MVLQFKKEEPKQIKCYCGHTDYCDCGPLEEPKQETLEEAAKGYSERHQDVSGNLGKYLVSAVFQDGAKWQQERMYSEEDMTEYAIYIVFNNLITPKQWLEQFKNKQNCLQIK